MKYIELFAGVGGFRLGIERAFGVHNGIGATAERDPDSTPGLSNDSIYVPQTGRLSATCAYSNEWDKYAAQTYNKNFGEQGEQIDTRDITTIPTSDIPDHDLLVGGFPCQAFSVAGKRRGFDETRGTLFFEIARILADKKPQHLLLENVKGLLSHDEGRTFQTIIGVLAGLGYRVEWQVLNSKDFGVPQNRERVFIIGHLGACCGRQVFPIGAGNGQAVGKIIDGPQAERVHNTDGLSVTINSGSGGLGGKTGLYAVKVDLRNEHTYPTKLAGTLQARDYKGFQNFQHNNAVVNASRIRRLTPIECERLQGFPDNWTEGVSDTQRYKQMGNAVTVNVIEAIVRRLI